MFLFVLSERYHKKYSQFMLLCIFFIFIHLHFSQVYFCPWPIWLLPLFFQIYRKITNLWTFIPTLCCVDLYIVYFCCSNNCSSNFAFYFNCPIICISCFYNHISSLQIKKVKLSICLWYFCDVQCFGYENIHSIWNKTNSQFNCNEYIINR